MSNFTKDDIPEIVSEVINAINEIKDDDSAYREIKSYQIASMSIDQIQAQLSKTYYNGMVDGIKTISSILERMLK